MTEYRVIDLRSAVIEPEAVLVDATSPENAAETILGIKLVRSGAKAQLCARVYWQNPSQPTNMVRLYSEVESDRRR